MSTRVVSRVPPTTVSYSSPAGSAPRRSDGASRDAEPPVARRPGRQSRLLDLRGSPGPPPHRRVSGSVSAPSRRSRWRGFERMVRWSPPFALSVAARAILGSTPPEPPRRIPSEERDEARQALRTGVRRFLLRLYRAYFLEEQAVREACALLGIDLEEERPRPRSGIARRRPGGRRPPRPVKENRPARYPKPRCFVSSSGKRIMSGRPSSILEGKPAPVGRSPVAAANPT